ncbi:MAG: hypothetical protein ACD_57C00311G0005 [uncultured bacterium]|uniref:DUF5615 domain-containing protein n=1 Tax=Candidatus Woesebacteria bacterium RIFCSPHIGHO2_12_FULL_41_24 TaxID=1802510 RepID=A0A1F8ATW5_9BACT|nr:MAG: hypothetical protein ACD_57C00311G0005 [uncultured bacterium]OGM14705.1 MAG: hypothetical protein A2W15_01945 [Candidatus Woesebacteria bacterium RBG_16_41_13]OGM29719.1 MAG: hypothetical protein A2873_02365 [Candidatus Woesebacteria bacterium RIFCSPHIGHO2_01_FULL_42_80]OGM35247.1 MAG: hypothetical protein A3D84_00445 [Candidatus Woesebacteria bacterium RIFCSPHIGHO2_02_FULL_42_20]OGM55141.1 MAG: hypothetical protein A3E44_04450 [Candidatus Woesebacteria bacterium RIFCSPHIGHO2_12_FULL_41
MRLLADENVYFVITNRLSGLGFSVTSVYKEGLISESDLNILLFARKKNLVILTQDKDFTVLHNAYSHKGIVLLRKVDKSLGAVMANLIKFLEDDKGKSVKDKIISALGVADDGDTVEEALSNVTGAIKTYVDSLTEDKLPVPHDETQKDIITTTQVAPN